MGQNCCAPPPPSQEGAEVKPKEQYVEDASGSEMEASGFDKENDAPNAATGKEDPRGASAQIRVQSSDQSLEPAPIWKMPSEPGQDRATDQIATKALIDDARERVRAQLRADAEKTREMMRAAQQKAKGTDILTPREEEAAQDAKIPEGKPGTDFDFKGLGEPAAIETPAETQLPKAADIGTADKSEKSAEAADKDAEKKDKLSTEKEKEKEEHQEQLEKESEPAAARQEDNLDFDFRGLDGLQEGSAKAESPNEAQGKAAAESNPIVEVPNSAATGEEKKELF